MTLDQTAILLVLITTLGLFVWGRWRYDVVALLALFSCSLLGLIPAQQVFSGFGHPATITVAIVLILSYGLSKSGALDWVARMLAPLAEAPLLHMTALVFTAAFLSMFMNNVGALALLMPLAVQSSIKAEQPPGAILMPLSFASILGGLVTMVGTPPNIIIANYRQDIAAEPFGMFDFTPVGGVVAIAGILFLILFGRKLIPIRKSTAGTGLFDIETYLFEVKIQKDSGLTGKTIREIGTLLDECDVVLTSLIHKKEYYPVPPMRHTLAINDLLILKGKQEDIDKLVSDHHLALLGANNARDAVLHAAETVVMEVALAPGSRLEGRQVSQVRFKSYYGINLLALSRQGVSNRGRLRDQKLKVGDVLLIHGEQDDVEEAITKLGCFPLQKRGVEFGKRKYALPALVIFGIAIAVATAGLAPIAVSLGSAAVIFVLLNIIPARELYDGIDWPVIVLLGAMIPVGGVLENTGVTELVAKGLLNLAGDVSIILVMVIVLVITMTLSDILNNAATVILMAPIAKNIAELAEASVDPFLMAVAIGASCAFLTPIGHQNNALILGPGGYRFGDYWRLGLPLEIIITLVAVPLILVVWPLYP
jgi:di/tricarboxylate transporter